MHDEVISGQDYLVEELRSLAVDLGDIWLDKISFRTERLLTIEELVGEESPLADLLKIVDQLLKVHMDATEMLNRRPLPLRIRCRRPTPRRLRLLARRLRLLRLLLHHTQPPLVSRAVSPRS